MQAEEKLKDKARLCAQFSKTLLDEYIFNEDKYQEMRNTSKFKFLHIGLTLWKTIIDSIAVWDPKCKAREQLLDTLVTANFLKVLVKNISNTKAQLHD